MNMTSKQLNELIRGGARVRGMPKPSAANAKRVKLRDEYDSKSEAAYADHLALLLGAKQIRAWIPHPFRLKLGDGANYTPDFLVEHNDGTIEIVEVKGWQWTRDVVRFKWAATKFNCFRWIMVKREGRNGWSVIRRCERSGGQHRERNDDIWTETTERKGDV